MLNRLDETWLGYHMGICFTGVQKPHFTDLFFLIFCFKDHLILTLWSYLYISERSTIPSILL